MIRPLFLLGAVLVLLAAPLTSKAQRGLDPPGSMLPDNSLGAVGDWFALQTYSGDVMQYSEFEGRVLFVNFWASWCRPCLKEMPAIVALADTMKGADVAFLLISIDEDPRDFRLFVKKYELEELAYLRAWENGTSSFEGGMVPATFIVDKRGNIVYKHHGAADWNTESVRRFLINTASG